MRSTTFDYISTRSAEIVLGRLLKRVLGSDVAQLRRGGVRYYCLPPLEVARKAWSTRVYGDAVCEIWDD